MTGQLYLNSVCDVLFVYTYWQVTNERGEKQEIKWWFMVGNPNLGYNEQPEKHQCNGTRSSKRYSLVLCILSTCGELEVVAATRPSHLAYKNKSHPCEVMGTLTILNH